MNIAVTGVGGGVGQSIIKSLQNTRYNVVGIDSELFGTGLYATKKAYLGVYANSPDFIDKIIEICKKEHCEIILPGLDVELDKLSANFNQLKKEKIVPIVSSPRVIEISNDKLKTVEFLKKYGFPYPRTFKLKDYSFELDFPVILKPRIGGSRSIGTFVVNNLEEFEEYSKFINIKNYIVQEYIDGDEYTCGTVFFKNDFFGAILMKRQLRDGDTYKAFVVKDEKLSKFVEDVIGVLKPFGPCNLQLRIKDNIPYIFEFNARCSGTTASRSLAGFNEPKMICDYLNGDKPHYNIKEIVIFRYWNEIVVDYEKIENLYSKGHITNKEVRL